MEFEKEYLLKKCDCVIIDPQTQQTWSMIKLLFAAKSGYFRTLSDSVWSNNPNQNRFVSPCDLSSFNDAWNKVRDYILFSVLEVPPKLFHQCWHLANVFQMDGYRHQLTQKLENASMPYLNEMNHVWLFSGEYCSFNYIRRLNECFGYQGLISAYSPQYFWCFLSLLKMADLKVEDSVYLSKIHKSKTSNEILMTCTNTFLNVTLIFPDKFAFVFRKTWKIPGRNDCHFFAYHYNTKSKTIDYKELREKEDISNLLCVGMNIVSNTEFEFSHLSGIKLIDIQLVPVSLHSDKIK